MKRRTPPCSNILCFGHRTAEYYFRVNNIHVYLFIFRSVHMQIAVDFFYIFFIQFSFFKELFALYTSVCCSILCLTKYQKKQNSHQSRKSCFLSFFLHFFHLMRRLAAQCSIRYLLVDIFFVCNILNDVLWSVETFGI